MVGETICIAVSEGDEIVFAQRPGRRGLTKFVRNRNPEPCRYVTVVLKRIPEGYLLVTGFIGRKAEPEPWDDRHFQQQADPAAAETKARAFWEKRALVMGIEQNIPGTETSACPW